MSTERDLKEDEVPVCTGIDAPTYIHSNSPGSTDVGYLTHLVPTSPLRGWGMVCGVPMHSWGPVAAVAHPIGLKAAVFSGMALAQCSYDILKNPSVLLNYTKEIGR